MTLSELLSPVSEVEFFANYYTQRAMHIPGKGEKLAHVFSYDELNRLLNSGPAPLPTLKVAKEGKPIPIDDAIGILQAIQNGATLIIDCIDTYSRGLKNKITQWSHSFGEPLQVNLYLSQPDNQGFLTHYDTHDVLILQIAGFKRWRIFDPTVQFPLWVQKEHNKDVPETPYLDVNLAPGDVLYVPRGHWHDATAYSESSMHLTVGINSRTGIDYLSWLTNELRSREIWRRDFLPASSRTNTDPMSSLDLKLRTTQLKEHLLAIFDSLETLSAYEAYCKASERKSFTFDFPHQMRDPARLRKKSVLPGCRSTSLDRRRCRPECDSGRRRGSPLHPRNSSGSTGKTDIFMSGV